ncbi:GILT-like protein 1 [Condylostylus longicornis]|uniref:GILT-like protein 1 n=1 Tax=Condylostylus longicornis TaxID=2530218 RepID=UPI00244E52A1|nr:GILT-like protein 1 [Condylostylus longicornis]XP_055373067.1 GILT-like protein 1 [Condylostylus longicornis]
MMYKFLGLLAVISVCSATIKVKIDVYYESLCPDSAAFITEQLYPVVKEDLKNYVDINWIPFGKSTFETRGSEVLFECHHGPNECYGNKVHSCAIDNIQANSYEIEHTKASLQLDFINCLMKIGKNFPDNKYPGEKCARENHINNWENIQQCANSTEGSQLLKKNGERTMEFQNPLKSVPTIVFSEQYDDDRQRKALTNFRGFLCQYIAQSQPSPRVCQGINSSGKNYIAPILIVLGSAISRLF